MPSYDITIGGKSYHVEIADPGKTPLEVSVDGQTFSVEVAGIEGVNGLHSTTASNQGPVPPPRRPPQPRATLPSCPCGEEIIAPMPGIILSIEVEQGEQVESGQVVCILEAMKMKNPIRACSAGVVAEVAVATGQNVSYGDLLVMLG